MAIDRREREVVEELVRKLTAVSNCLTILEAKVTVLEALTEVLSESSLGDLTTDGIQDLIDQAVKNIVNDNGTSLRKHNHLSDSAGGDCFAKKGASLIE